MNSLRMVCKTGMDWFAHSMRRFPISARSIFLISNEICGITDDDIRSLFGYSAGADARFRFSQAKLPQPGSLVGGLPGEIRIFAAKVSVGSRLFVNGPAQLQRFDNAFGRELEVLAH